MTTSIIYSIFIFFAVFSLAGAGLLYIQFKYQQKQYITSWIIGTLLIGIATSLIALRDIVPEFVSYKLGNGLAIASYIYFYYSSISLLGKKIEFDKIALNAFLAVSIFVIALILVGNHFGIGYQPALVALCAMILNLLTGSLIFKFYKQSQNNLAFVLAAILFVTTLIFGIRCLMVLHNDVGFVFQGGQTNVISFILLLALGLAKYLSFAGLAVSIEWVEKKSLIEKNNQITALLMEKDSLIQNLIKANKTSATGALSASIAHELNQPLSASNLNIQFLQRKLGKNELSPELGAQVLTSLQSDNQRATVIIRSLRSIFLETKLDVQASNFNELVNAVLVIIRPELKKDNIALNVDLCEIKEISINPSEMQQVILNLLNNAIQALVTSEMTNKVITLRSVIHGDALRFSIADNGAGVAEANQDNLFELLNSSKQVGMGLGLWLCKHIVTRHGGMLWYETALGGGANFVMELPLSSPR